MLGVSKRNKCVVDDPAMVCRKYGEQGERQSRDNRENRGCSLPPDTRPRRPPRSGHRFVRLCAKKPRESRLTCRRNLLRATGFTGSRVARSTISMYFTTSREIGPSRNRRPASTAARCFAESAMYYSDGGLEREDAATCPALMRVRTPSHTAAAPPSPRSPRQLPTTRWCYPKSRSRAGFAVRRAWKL
jgi:hypothetical protein